MRPKPSERLRAAEFPPGGPRVLPRRRVAFARAALTVMTVALELAGCGREVTLSLLPGPSVARPVRNDAGMDGEAGACTGDRECPATKPRCDSNSRACVECLVDGDCAIGLCETAAHTCTGCNTNLDCPLAAPICDLDVHVCVQCESSSQCPSGQVCAFESHRCAPACSTDSDCAGSGRPTCAPASRVCVECTTDADCAALGRPPRCDLFNGTCVPCLSDADCSAGRCRTLEHLCVECLTASDCDGRVCTQFRCGP